MPQSRELANKKNDQKDHRSRGPAGSGQADVKKGGAGAHNWGVSTAEDGAMIALDKNDPNYDSSQDE
ncbi:TPA: hypothetical protein N0F65_009599 [Lagenidium giganteum]|uniref:Hyaluronan/mRNA-binding protein domain-containing protein n=1 Tax=Lagenidium giganteum TaxID=4803 RepID=A0AAV2YRY8_9STRA|nr:TPA: hypothetical protein N0F65_009599 [Lagenidium giganteum]